MQPASNEVCCHCEVAVARRQGRIEHSVTSRTREARLRECSFLEIGSPWTKNGDMCGVAHIKLIFKESELGKCRGTDAEMPKSVDSDSHIGRFLSTTLPLSSFALRGKGGALVVEADDRKTEDASGIRSPRAPSRKPSRSLKAFRRASLLAWRECRRECDRRACASRLPSASRRVAPDRSIPPLHS